MQSSVSKTPPPPPPSQPQMNPQQQQPQLAHQIQPSQTTSSLHQRVNDHRSTHSVSGYAEPMIMNNGSSNIIPSNNVTSSGSKKVTWNGNTATLIPSQPPPMSSSSSLSFPAASSSSVKTNSNNSNSNTEPHSPQEDHSFTLKDISEVLEMDDEQDPNNSKGGYTPNVIGAQEVYKDPRERIKAEKMKNQPQKNIPGPEKLTIKEKIRLFAEESNSQPK